MKNMGSQWGFRLKFAAVACSWLLLAFLGAADVHAARSYTITATAGSGGSISPSGAVVVNRGANQTFVITPNTGYTTADVTVDSVSQGAITSYTFTNVTANHTIAATFAINTSAISITINSPSAGATIYRPDVMVMGTITNAGGYETGVAVNGIAAHVYGNQFVVNHVPLQEGSNSITATATDSCGDTATVSITVYASTTGNYIRITSDTESGIPPLEVTLQVDGSFSISASTITVTGPVQPEFLSSTATEYRVRMTVEGVYYFTATVTGPDNNQYQDTTSIIVMSRTAMDNLLKGIWANMKSALSTQDINAALNYFTADSKPLYNDIFTALFSQLPQFVQAMQDIQLIYVKDGGAKYRIIKNELYGGQMLAITYYIYFAVDEDGTWKIDRF